MENLSSRHTSAPHKIPSTFLHCLKVFYKKILELLKTKYLLVRVAFLIISLREVSTVKGLKFFNKF